MYTEVRYSPLYYGLLLLLIHNFSVCSVDNHHHPCGTVNNSQVNINTYLCTRKSCIVSKRVCVCVRVRVCVCVCVCVCMCACASVCIHNYYFFIPLLTSGSTSNESLLLLPPNGCELISVPLIHTWATMQIYTYINTHIHTRMCKQTCMQTYTHTCTLIKY